MKNLLMVLSLSVFGLGSTSMAQSCFQGKFEVNGVKGKAMMSFKIDTDKSKNSVFNSIVINPDDSIWGYSKENELKEFKVSDLIRPDNNLKLIPIEGLKCPCSLALQTEDGQLEITVEALADGKTMQTMTYFGLGRVNVTDFGKCD